MSAMSVTVRAALGTFSKMVPAAAAPALVTALSSAAAPPLIERKVTILGAAGGIGQPLSMLMKMNKHVTQLALFDIAGTKGVAADVSHMNTHVKVDGYAGDEELGEALKGSDLVIIPAGVPRKPGMTRDDLFNINAGIVMKLVSAIAEHCPGATINMISNPVNSTVPIAAETLKKHGVYNPKKLFGVTTLDVVRARTFFAEKKGLSVSETKVPVIGGHAGVTILPLLSQATPSVTLSDKERDDLTKRTQDGGTEVVQAKEGKGSATLSMAYAGCVFADACLRGMNSESDVIECAYVDQTAGGVVSDLPFFASPVRLGKEGVTEFLPIGELNEYEKAGFEAMKPELSDSIQKGVDFVKNN